MICFQPSNETLSELEKLCNRGIHTIQGEESDLFTQHNIIFSGDYSRKEIVRMIILNDNEINLVNISSQTYRVIRYLVNSGIVAKDESHVYQKEGQGRTPADVLNKEFIGWADVCLNPDGSEYQSSRLSADIIRLGSKTCQYAFWYIIHCTNKEMKADDIERGLVKHYKIAVPYKLTILNGINAIEVSKGAEAVPFEELVTHFAKCH